MKIKCLFTIAFLFLLDLTTLTFATEKNVNVNKEDYVAISKFIENFSNKLEDVNKITNEKIKENKLYDLSNEVLDLKWMANFILGKNRNTITDEEKNEFIENYSRTLIRNYIPVLDVYKNGDYKILSMESSKENNFNVSTIINYNNNEVKNNFKIIKKNNGYFIRDIITEGVSFISAQRSEINSIISSKGFNNFLTTLKEKNGSK